MNIAAEFMSAITNAFEAKKRPEDRAVEQVPDHRHLLLCTAKYCKNAVLVEAIHIPEPASAQRL
jgi:hypothetical protein